MGKIILDKVSFSYNTHKVLEDVSMTVDEHQIATILGPNGGGKTTLLKVILGTVKPQSGRVLIDGQPPQTLQKKIGYVSQHPDFDPKFPITVFEVVLSGRVKRFGFYSKEDRETAAGALEEAGLSGFRDQPFNELSGGQKQRMLIARALASEMQILLLDEPTSNIDFSAEKRLHELLSQLSSRLTIILVTHDTGFVNNITDRVFCVNRTLVEHPIDEDFSEIVAAAYGTQAKIVRHDERLHKAAEHRSDA